MPIGVYKHHPHQGFQKGNKYALSLKGKPNLKLRRENHYLWIKDRKLIKRQKERNNPEYKQWRQEIFKRDKHICRINNKDCQGKVVAHHILPWADYPELRYNINNGITLCQTHHPRKRVEEKKLMPFFNSLVEVK